MVLQFLNGLPNSHGRDNSICIAGLPRSNLPVGTWRGKLQKQYHNNTEKGYTHARLVDRWNSFSSYASLQ